MGLNTVDVCAHDYRDIRKRKIYPMGSIIIWSQRRETENIYKANLIGKIYHLNNSDPKIDSFLFWYLLLA